MTLTIGSNSYELANVVFAALFKDKAKTDAELASPAKNINKSIATS
jgi:hypothetical protein